MAQIDAPALEFGLWTPGGAGGVAGRRVFQGGLGAQDGQHVFGIGLPVGGQVDVAAGQKATGQKRHELGLNETAFVVAFFRPRIGKEDVDTGERFGPNHVCHDFHGVVGDDAYVADAKVVDFSQQATDARGVDFYAEEIRFRMSLGDGGRGLAHAEADFEHARRFPPEQGREVHGLGPVGHQPARAKVFEGPPLGVGNAAGATHETAHGAADGGFWHGSSGAKTKF